jgi:hypothetical protein
MQPWLVVRIDNVLADSSMDADIYHPALAAVPKAKKKNGISKFLKDTFVPGP